MPIPIKRPLCFFLFLIVTTLYNTATLAITFNEAILGWNIQNQSTSDREYIIPTPSSPNQHPIVVYILTGTHVKQVLSLNPGDRFILQATQTARITADPSDAALWLHADLRTPATDGDRDTVDLSTHTAEKATYTDDESIAEEHDTSIPLTSEQTEESSENSATKNPEEVKRLLLESDRILQQLMQSHRSVETQAREIRGRIHAKIKAKQAFCKELEERIKRCRLHLFELQQNEASLSSQLAEIQQEPSLQESVATMFNRFCADYDSLLKENRESFASACCKEKQHQDRTTCLDTYCHACDGLLDKYLAELDKLCSRENTERLATVAQKRMNLNSELMGTRELIEETRRLHDNLHATLALVLPNPFNETTRTTAVQTLPPIPPWYIRWLQSLGLSR